MNKIRSLFQELSEPSDVEFDLPVPKGQSLFDALAGFVSGGPDQINEACDVTAKLIAAIKVVLLTAGTRAYLMEYDPQCLKQLTAAINDAGEPLTVEQEENIGYAVEDILSPKARAEYLDWLAKQN